VLACDKDVGKAGGEEKKADGIVEVTATGFHGPPGPVAGSYPPHDVSGSIWSWMQVSGAWRVGRCKPAPRDTGYWVRGIAHLAETPFGFLASTFLPRHTR
jgi:hypothetical protein